MWPVDQQAFSFYMPSATLLMSMAALILGLVLWAMGAKLLRTVCTASSIVLGGAIGYLVARQIGAQQMIGLWVIGGALLGLILSWTLFMLWVCAGTGAILAAIVPAVVLIWHGMEFRPPELVPTSSAYRVAAGAQWPQAGQGMGPNESFEWGESGELEEPPRRDELDELDGMDGPGELGEASHRFARMESDSVAGLMRQELTRPNGLDDGRDGKRIALLDRLVLSRFGPQVDGVVSWWVGLEEVLRHRLMMAAAAGALVGVFGGLLLPNISAACVSSFAGAFFILVGMGGLMMRLAPRWNQAIEPYPATTVLILLLVTAGGAWLQYRSLRRAGNA